MEKQIPIPMSLTLISKAPPFISVLLPPRNTQTFFCWTKSVSTISKEHQTLTLGSKVNSKYQLAIYFHRALTFPKRKVLLIYFGLNFRKLEETAEKDRKKIQCYKFFQYICSTTSCAMYLQLFPKNLLASFKFYLGIL